MYSIKVKDFDIQQIADSGQCFRMNKVNNNTYSVIAFKKYVEIKQEKNTLIFSCSKEEYENTWKYYFDLQTNYGELISNSIIECPNIITDKFLLNAISYSSGIRILRQEFFEMLISFIISQRKSIPAIKSCIEKICKKYGNKLKGIGFNGEVEYYTFPSCSELGKATTRELKECSLGYRAEYVYNAWKWYSNKYNNLLSERIKYYPNALNELMNIKGVGIKIANCICLFSLHQFEAIPIDIWIQRIIDEDYNGIKPNWMQSRYAGLLQQYVFYYVRSNRKGGD